MKSFLLTLLFVSITTFTYAQDAAPKEEDKKSQLEETPEVLFGVRAGFNISNLDFEPHPNFENKHRNGFAFGGFVDYGITTTFSILAELQYSAEGAEAESLRADYLQLPILFKLSIAEGFSIGVGPMVSLKTWAHEDGFKNVNFSGVGGMEYMINEELFIDVRIHYTFGNILDNDIISSFEAKSTTIQIGIGFKI